MLAEHPIIMSPPMIRAILADKKTQTRRVITHPEYFGCLTGDCPHDKKEECEVAIQGWLDESPYKVGNKLWVRETYRYFNDGDLFYKADAFAQGEEYIPVHADDEPEDWRWQNAMFMPRKHSRITLGITDARVQRLQDITHRDALAEGVEYDVSKPDGAPLPRYRALWDHINAKRGFPWESNPWVRRICFRTLRKNFTEVEP